jgi:polyisoprenoid-binding protein YceI
MAWEFDKSHTNIGFSAKHMMVSTVRGRFESFDGVVDLNEPNPADSHVDVTINAASVSTNDPRRDGHLKSADFFDVEKYPTITYKSTKVEKLSDEKYRVTGDLTVKNITRQVPLDVTFEGDSRDMQGQRRAGFTITTTINRKEFELNWNVALEAGGWLVGDTIKIEIDTEVFEPTQVAAAAGSAKA